MATDLADAGDTDGAPGEGGLAPRLLGRGAHALEGAVRRQHRAVARAAVGDGAAGDEVALARDVVHVLAERAHVARGEVAAVERLHEAAVGAQQGLGLQLGRVADDDGLAAAEVEAGERVLVGHAAREVEDVDDRVVGAGVGVEPRPAEGRAQCSGVDGDDGPQAGRAVVAEDDLLVLAAELEDVDAGTGYSRHAHGSFSGGCGRGVCGPGQRGRGVVTAVTSRIVRRERPDRITATASRRGRRGCRSRAACRPRRGR